MRKLLVTVLALVTIGLIPIGQASAQEATPMFGGTPLVSAADLGVSELAITLTGNGFEAPKETAAGRYLVTFTNNADYLAQVELMKPPADWTLDQLKPKIEAVGSDTVSPDDIAWIYDMPFAGGGEAGSGGGVGQSILDLTPGRWVIADLELEGPAQLAELNVTGEMPKDLPVPKANATVTAVGTATGYDFSIDGTIGSGPQIIEFTNKSDQPHFIASLISPVLLTDETFMQLATMAEGGGTPVPGSGAPSPAEVQDGPASGVVSAGGTFWWIVDLKPGFYTFACFVPDHNGTPHAFEGMVEHFEVK